MGGMILVPVSRSELAAAQDWNEQIERGGEGRGLFKGKGWIGWLGERALAQALRDAGAAGVVHHGGLDGKPDLEVAGRTVGVKTTQKRNLCLVPKAHLLHEWGWWFFCGWRHDDLTVELRGAMRPDEFRARARLHEVGSEPWIRYPCYSVEVAALTDAAGWLSAAAAATGNTSTSSEPRAA